MERRKRVVTSRPLVVSLALCSGLLIGCDPEGISESPDGFLELQEDAKRFAEASSARVKWQAALIIVDGQELTPEDHIGLMPDDVASLAILRGKEAIEQYGHYGEKVKNGVIVITLKETPEKRDQDQ